MLTLPAFTYALDHITGSPKQAVTGADRPVCALTAALSYWVRGGKLMGAARHMTEDQIEATFQSAFAARGLGEDRVKFWLGGLAGEVVPLKPITPIAGLTPSLYQVGAIGRMTQAGGVLNLGVGLGKTLTTAYAADCYARIVAPSRCWIVAPLVAHGAWRAYLPHLKARYGDVQILSIDSVHKFAGAAPVGGLLIVDEAHYAGVMAARRTKALHTLRLGFDACLCLTGTLLHGGVEKALAVLDLAIPGAAGFSSRWKAGEYFNVLVKKRIGGRTVTSLEKPTGPRRALLMQYLSRYTVALTKESPQVKAEVQIPGQDLHTIEIGDCGVGLDELVADLALRLFEKTGKMPNAQTVAHYALRQGTSAKLDWLLSEMDDPAQGVVVFAQYHETLDEIQDRLIAEQISFVRVDGSVTGPDREAAVRHFQEGQVQVFLGQMTAAGAAINLYRSHISVTFDHCQKAADYAQMLGRTCRRGQDLHCHHFDLVANGLQRMVVERLRDAEDFHLSLSRIQDAIPSGSPCS